MPHGALGRPPGTLLSSTCVSLQSCGPVSLVSASFSLINFLVPSAWCAWDLSGSSCVVPLPGAHIILLQSKALPSCLWREAPRWAGPLPKTHCFPGRLPHTSPWSCESSAPVPGWSSHLKFGPGFPRGVPQACVPHFAGAGLLPHSISCCSLRVGTCGCDRLELGLGMKNSWW